MVQISGSNFYARLGVSIDATPEEIRRAYFEAARRIHPDANPGPDAAELFNLLHEAYEILSNPEKRTLYNATLPITNSKRPLINWKVTYSRTNIPWIGEEQMIYALLEIEAAPDKTDTVSSPLNLCLVLDRSTSMQGPRMDMVKSNAINLLRQMTSHDLVSIVSFSDRAEVVVPPSRLNELSKIESKINQLNTGGATEIFNGLELGINQVRRNMSPGYINQVILLTDGRTYGDEDACIHLAEEAGAQGIGISGLGIGHEWNDALLDQIANLSGGTSMFISSPKEMQKFFEDKYKNLGKIYAEQVNLEFVPNPNIDLVYTFRLQPDAGVISTESPVRLGNLLITQPMTIIFEFKVKPVEAIPENIVLLRGFIRMDIPTQTIPTQKVNLTFSRPVTTDPEAETAPRPVVQALSKLTLYRMQERARREVAAGDIDKATRHLQYLATNLLSQGEKNLAITVLEEAENILRNNKYTKEGDKRIKYGTRSLMLPSGMEDKYL